MEYESGEDSPFVFVPIQVSVLDSDIYANDSGMRRMEDIGEATKDFVLKLPIYKQCYVPICSLMEQLVRVSGINFERHQVLYRTSNTKCYTLAGTFPFESAMLYLKLGSLSDRIFIKYRIADKTFQTAEEKKNKLRRGKERKISEVLDTLFQWKRMSTPGIVKNKKKRAKKMNRQEAANVLKMPKKSLEDYMLQVRIAHENGFDFNLFSNTKFGVVREFNRKTCIKG